MSNGRRLAQNHRDGGDLLVEDAAGRERLQCLAHGFFKSWTPVPQNLGRGCRHGERAADQIGDGHLMTLPHFDIFYFAES
jgi:hypothetical protein